MTLRYGLIGAGMMGQEHIRNVQLLDGADIVALADPNEGMRQKSEQLLNSEVQSFHTLSDLLSADVCDAYIIAAPNDLHHAILLEAIPANKPILCEKPFCTTSRDCRDIIAQSAHRSAPIWIAMEYRYMPPIQRLLGEITSGTAGSPVMMAIREHRFPFLDKIGDWNRFNNRTGGTLVEKCCHFWDLMRLTLDSNPIRVFASASADINHQDETYGGETPDIIDNAYVVVDFENGSRGLLDLCMFAEGSYWQEVISVTGNKARIDACVPGPARFSATGEERHSQIVVSDRASKQVTTETIDVDLSILAAGDHHGSTYFQHEKFLRMLKEGGRPDVGPEDGLWSVLVGEAAERSAQSGQAVTLSAL